MRQRITDRTLTRKAPAKGTEEIWDDLLPGFGLRVGKTRRTFFAMARIGGKQVRYKIGTTDTHSLAAARDEARDFLRDAAKGIDPRAATNQREATEAAAPPPTTFRHVAKEFMTDKGSKFRTSDEVQRKLDKDILPELGDRPIAEITRAEIKEHLRKKARTAPIAANRNLGVIRQVFNFALDEEYIETSPCVRIAPPGDEVERDRVLTDDELKALWEASEKLTGSEAVYGRVVRLLMLTGCRRDEIAEMPAPEIDREQKMLVIPASRYKTRTEHAVPLTSMALNQLPEIPEPTEDVPVPFVFSTTGGEKPFSNFSKAKAALVKKSKVDGWWNHDIRRTVETNLAKMGFGKELRDRVLGHTPDGIQRRYNRFDYLDQKRQALDAWAEYLEAVVTGKKPPANVVDLRAG